MNPVVTKYVFIRAFRVVVLLIPYKFTLALHPGVSFASGSNRKNYSFLIYKQFHSHAIEVLKLAALLIS